jgi:cytochrome c556
MEATTTTTTKVETPKFTFAQAEEKVKSITAQLDKLKEKAQNGQNPWLWEKNNKFQSIKDRLSKKDESVLADIQKLPDKVDCKV